MEPLRSIEQQDDAISLSQTDDYSQRVVAWTPTAQDARICDQILRENNISVSCHDTISEFSAAIADGAGIALVAQEHLNAAAIEQLQLVQGNQPKWSELPILVLLQPGDIASATLQSILSIEHVTLINRPLRIAVFVNTVKAKLRDRMRQFEVRDLLYEKERARRDLHRKARRLNMAVKAGGMATWEWSQTDVYWSNELRSLYGFSSELTPSEEAMFEAIDDADRQNIKAQWVESLEHDRAFNSEFRVHHPKLGERWIAAVAEPVKAKSGKTIRYAGLQWDVTARKSSEIELRQSQETFQRLIEDNPQGLYVVDHEMRIRYVSAGAKNVFANLNPIIGRPFAEVMHSIWPAQFADEAVSLFRHTLETGKSYTAPTLVERRVDIEAVEAYDWSIERIMLPGNSFGVVCHFYDTTERQQSLETLQQSEKYFRDIANASPAMLWVTDEEHMCTFMSKSWYDKTGQTESESMGLGWTYAAHPADRQRAADEFLAAANARDPFALEYRLKMTDGSYRWAVDVGSPRFDSVGSFLGYTGYVIDVHERKEFEQSLRKAKRSAEAANRSRGEFLANMSHEIRTPMAAIIGHADILKDHLKDPDNRQVVETIRRNGKFLLDIINDILDLSKIDAGKMDIDKQPVRPDSVVAEVRSLMDVRAAEKQLKLKIEFAGPVPETVHTDAVRLRQILVNLIGNAIKFTERGEVRLRVSYHESKDNKQGTSALGSSTNGEDTQGNQAVSPTLTFEVADTGIGIAEDKMETLFDPFVQADNTPTRSFGGTGLGLTICKRLAHALGGDISVESVLGKGSRFLLSIAAHSPSQLVEPNLTRESRPEALAEEVRLTARILVVDDRRDIRYLAQHFIEKAGGEVHVATNGQEAIDFIEASDSPTVDLIVMDMQMPVMDGYTATAELRRRGCTLPIIALTANAMKSDRDECLTAGCNDYTTKPLDSKVLVSMIDRLTQ